MDELSHYFSSVLKNLHNLTAVTNIPDLVVQWLRGRILEFTIIVKFFYYVFDTYYTKHNQCHLTANCFYLNVIEREMHVRIGLRNINVFRYHIN